MSTPDTLLLLVEKMVGWGVPPAEAAKAAAAVLTCPPGDKLLTPAELGALVHRSEATVRRWCHEETIPSVKVGAEILGIHWPTFIANQTKKP